MKKPLIALTTVLAIGSSVTSCKKGENDPFLSLKTRKTRLCGEWKVVNSTTEDIQSDGSKTTTVFDGTNETTVQYNASSGNSTSSTKILSEEWTFDKDYTFTYTSIEHNGTTKYEGSWAFMGQSKQGEVKKKENIGLRILNYTFTPTSGPISTSTYSGDQEFTFIFEIDQLKNKEIVIKTSSENAFTFNGSVDKYSNKSSSTLELK